MSELDSSMNKLKFEIDVVPFEKKIKTKTIYVPQPIYIP